jgi:hypothetical protein
MLGHSWFIWMIKPDVMVVLLDPGINGTTGLSNVVLATLTDFAVNSWCFQVKVFLQRLNETGDLPRWDVYAYDVMSH